MRRAAFALALLSAACGGAPTPPMIDPAPPIAISDAGAAAVHVLERATPDAPFREHEPPATTTEPFVFPSAHESRLSNGVRVLFVPRSSTAFVSLRVVLVGGASAQPTERPGTFAAISVGLGAGTKTRSQRDLNDAFGALSMNAPAASGTSECVEVAGVAPASHYAAALELMGEQVRTPAFWQPTFERDLEVYARQIDRELTFANQIGPRVAARVLVGAHPLLASWPTPGEIRQASRADAMRAYSRALDPATLVVIAAGAVDEGELVAKVKEVFGTLPASTYKAPAGRPSAAAPANPRLVMVDVVGSSSTFVAIEGEGPTSARGERNAPLVALGVLADGAQSRVARALSKSLRHLIVPTKRFWFSRVGGAIGLEGTVVPSEVGAFLVAATATMSELAKTPPTDAELSDARARVVESSVRQFESVADITGTYANLVVTGSDLDHYTNIAADYARVTPESVRAAAARYLDPTHMRVVVVGDATTIEPQLRALHWGAIEHRDPSGVVLP